MRRLSLGCALAITLPFGATGQDRPVVPSMHCAQAAQLIQARGAVVVATSPTAYERIVRDQSFCALETTTAPAYLPTRDSPRCFVGYRCRDIERGESRSGG